MQRIKIGSDSEIQAPPAGQPDSPANLPGREKPPVAAPDALKGTVTEGDILKPVEGTKISTLQPFTPISGNTGISSPSGSSVSVGGMVDGKLAVELMDALLPSLLVMLMAAIGARMKKSDLQLTEKEKSTVAPVLQKCLDQLMINFNNPWSALGVTLAVIYGAKLTEKGFVQMLDKKQADKEMKELEKTGSIHAAEVKQQAPVISLAKAAETVKDVHAPVKIDVTTVAWEPSNDLIKACVKRYKINRKDSIIRLKMMYAKGQQLSINSLLNPAES
jgi:hypothetical protein